MTRSDTISRTLAAALVVVAVALPAAATAAPDFVRLAIGPDGGTSMTITWNTDGPIESEVRYGTSPGELTETETATAFRAPGALGHVHEVALEGLTPSTTYYYVAGSPAGGFTDERSFRTGPPADPDCGSLTFGYIGDNRPDETFGGGDNYPEVLGALAAHEPAFVLNGGDMVVDGDQIDQWVDFLDWTEQAGRDLPHMPTIGNHDDGPGEGDGAVYNQVWSLPRSTGEHGSGTEDYYYFTYGNAIFVSMSTDTFDGGETRFAEQAAWLDRVLTENPRRWKIVLMHKPIYTHQVVFDISHEPNEEGQNAAFVPVFDRHHVDLVLASHNHWYERFEPSACAAAGDPGSDEPCSVGAGNYGDGTVYVVSGGAGAFTIPAALCGGGFLDPVDGRVACDDPHHYLLFEIDDDTLRYEAHATDQGGGVFDSFTITRSDGIECGGDGEDVGVDASVEPDVGAEPDAGTDDTEVPDTGPGDDRPDPDVVEDEVVEADAGDDSPSEGFGDGPDEGSDGSGDDEERTGRQVPDDTGDPSSGCSCRASPRPARSGAPLLGMILLAALLRLRRRSAVDRPRGFVRATDSRALGARDSA